MNDPLKMVLTDHGFHTALIGGVEAVLTAAGRGSAKKVDPVLPE